ALHSLALGLKDTASVSVSDVVMPVVPQFHVNAWGMPFVSTWFCATQVMPGPRFTPERLARVIEEFKVTTTAGVPTIWLGLLKELERKIFDLDSVRRYVSRGFTVA